MVSVEFSTTELKKRLKVDIADLEEKLFTFGMELESSGAETTKIDLAGAGNRIDTVSFQGFCRVVEAYLGKRKGFKNPEVKHSGIEVIVAPEVEKVRPFIANMVVRNLKLDDSGIKDLMNYQEKVNETFGRARKRLGGGFFKLSEIKPPLYYSVENARDIVFAPLGIDQELTGEEILQKHEKGIKYASLFPDKTKLPVLKDSRGRYLAIPGITNSNDVGNIQPGTHDIFVELTGSDLRMMNQFMAAMSFDFAELGCGIESVTVRYQNKSMRFPNLHAREMDLETEQINKMLGLRLSTENCKKFLEKMLFNAHISGKKLKVEIPAFRSDVWHQVDLIDDIARAYGYDDFAPLYPKTMSIGSITPKTAFKNKLIEAMVGFGYQQIYSLIVARKIAQTHNIESGDIGFVEFEGARAAGVDCCRRHIFPSLLEILHGNKDARFPQKLFEVGAVIVPDNNEEAMARDILHMAGVLSSATANFSETKAIVELLAKELQTNAKFSPEMVPWYIHGRSAKVETELFVGHLGEIKPTVLTRFGIEMPVAAFELEFK